jgi:hypothetical protein
VLDATIACFVQSGVVTVPARNDRVHVFEHWSDAMEHVAEHGGARIAHVQRAIEAGRPGELLALEHHGR